MLYPVIELDVLGLHDNSTMCCVVAPEPVAISDAEVELLVKKLIVADVVPAAVGENVTVNGTLWPAANVTGKVSPPMLNAELFELIEDNVTLPPLAVRLPFWL